MSTHDVEESQFDSEDSQFVDLATSPRPSRLRRLSLRAMENFEVKRSHLVDCLEHHWARYSSLIASLNDRDDPAHTSLVLGKARKQFSMYTSTVADLSAFYVTTVTPEAR